MMAFSLRKALGATSALGLAISLAACGPDDLAVKDTGQFSLGEVTGPFDWPMGGFDDALENVSADAYGDWAPLGAARPLVARASATYKYAPAWDYPADYDYDAPVLASYYDGGYYEEGYYDSPYFEQAYYGPVGYDWYDRSPDTGTYALLALAAVLGGVIGNSPPDYYFYYGGVQPWVWITDDRYVRYAEPLPSGYRYYYYAPDAAWPFLVRDPFYTYGYSNDRLVVIYDSYGRVLNRDRALRLRRAASSYYDRGVALYQTGLTSERYGVSAPLWQQRSVTLVADQQVWDRARNWSPSWRDWNRRYDKAADKHWQRERIARTYAAKRFAAWKDDGYRSPAPQPGRELRSKGNPHKFVLEQAAFETRRNDKARFERGKVERSGLERGKIERGAHERGRMVGTQREDVLRGQGNASRGAAIERQADARAERKQNSNRDRQSAQLQSEARQQREIREQRVARQERVRSERRQADVQRGQQAERQRAESRQQQVNSQRARESRAERQQQVDRQQHEARRQQANEQRQQRAERQQMMAGQQQASAQREQQIARRQQAESQRQKRVERQQMMAGQQQASAQREQQIARRQQAESQRQQRAERQQMMAGQQQVQRQQQDGQAFAASEQRGQGGQGRGRGRSDH